MSDQDHTVTLQVVPGPDLRRDLPWDDLPVVSGQLRSRLDEQGARSREENAMGDAEGREDSASPAQSITSLHRDWQILQDVDDDDKEATRHEVQEESHDLRVDVRFEQEAGHIGEGDDRRWEEKEQKPDALIVLVEDKGQHDDQSNWNISHEYIEDDV